MKNTNLIIEGIEFDHEEEWYEYRFPEFKNEVIDNHVEARRKKDIGKLKALEIIMADHDIRYEFVVIDGVEFDYPQEVYGSIESFADELTDRFTIAVKENDENMIIKLEKIMADYGVEFSMEECDE